MSSMTPPSSPVYAESEDEPFEEDPDSSSETPAIEDAQVSANDESSLLPPPDSASATQLLAEHQAALHTGQSDPAQPVGEGGAFEDAKQLPSGTAAEDMPPPHDEGLSEGPAGITPGLPPTVPSGGTSLQRRPVHDRSPSVRVSPHADPGLDSSALAPTSPGAPLQTGAPTGADDAPENPREPQSLPSQPVAPPARPAHLLTPASPRARIPAVPQGSLKPLFRHLHPQSRLLLRHKGRRGHLRKLQDGPKATRLYLPSRPSRTCHI
ncbi:hypothetical protein KEM55_001030 [Ascosphaera atra]|nr:hypothetical protein KEM55_001030 [Ascosphaera atra]